MSYRAIWVLSIGRIVGVRLNERAGRIALQQLRRHISAVSIFCDDADGFIVVARDHNG